MNKRIIPASDDAWDERVLGDDEGFVEVADEAVSAVADAAAGTQLVSIRMQRVMIDEFKAIAARNGGMGYQTLMKQILQRFIDGEKRQLWNEYVSQELKAQKKGPGNETKPKAKTRERKVA